MKKHYKKGLNKIIITGSIAFLFLLSVILSVTNLMIHRNFIYSDYKSYIKDILNYSMSQIDADDLKVCIETKEESEKYKTTLKFMDNIMDHFHDIHYFYAIVPLNTNETGNVMSVLSAERYQDRYIDTEGNLYLGWISEDEFDAKTVKKYFEIMESDKIVYFEERTGWGTDYTGAISIRDSNGKSIAILAVDIDISFINSSILQYSLVNISIITILGIAFISIFLFWSRKNIIHPIQMLEQRAGVFVNHSGGQRDVEALKFDPPKISSDNEIKALTDAVVKMTKDMQDYVMDIISAEEKAANMQELANFDALTGVRNKLAYENDIHSISDSKYGIAVIDLNNLKKINDTYGHDKGDIIIKKLAKIVCDVFKHSYVYRIGGDEFAVILRRYDYYRFNSLYEKINNIFDKMTNDDKLEPWEKVSAAVGASFYEEGDDIEAVFNRADQAMYQRKKEMKDIRE